MARYSRSTAALDAAERSWWAANGELEERYCWVQEPRQQRVIRDHYLDQLTGRIPRGARVLEMGCGTGWLTLRLAERGVDAIVGTDFSADQLARARAAAAAEGLADRVRFEPAGGDAGGDFDVVIMHAFLHHLSTEEVEVVLGAAADQLRPGGQLLLLEPVHFADGPTTDPLVLKVLRRVEALPRMLAHRRLRRVSPDERAVRRQLGGRNAGEPPFGPAPKEVPFDPGELEGLLAPRFVVDHQAPALSFGHLVAQEVLIASLSQPRLWARLEPALLHLASRLDRRFVGGSDLPATVWVFVLFACTKRDA